MHSWELDAALDVLTMCSCHLPENDSIRKEVKLYFYFNTVFISILLLLLLRYDAWILLNGFCMCTTYIPDVGCWVLGTFFLVNER